MFNPAELGWDPFFENQWSKRETPEDVPARVAAEHRGEYEVWSWAGSGTARLSGRLRHESGEDAPVAVGDWVALDSAPGPDRITVIRHVLPRRTAFARGAAGRETREQVIAANVDRVFVVCGLDADFNIRRIQRYLTLVFASGAVPIVVLSKADVCDDVDSRVAIVGDACPGATVHAVSALLEQGLDAIRAAVGPGITVALVGSSGAGKSTLVNALMGREIMSTGEVREHDSRGRHTTTHRQLILLPGGGLLLDTPGLRELQLPGEDGLETAFEDVTLLAARCRFANCRHESEPGCAVRAAMEAGELPAERFEHFARLEREAAAFALRQDERARRQAERAWGKMTREADRLRRYKRGG